MSHGISAVVITRDEERNLPYALRSLVPWVSDLVVVDMHSRDRTREIAEEFGARVFLHEPTGFVEPAREFAIEQCREDWILILDADELVPEPLSRSLQEIARAGSAEAVRVPRLNYLLGDTLAHTGWGPQQDAQLRFFRRGHVLFGARIHEQPKVGAEARRIDLPPSMALIHFNYVDVSHFLEKLDRYTSIEAGQASGTEASAGLPRITWLAIRRFLGKYARRGGFRDGWRGFVLSVLQGVYVFVAGAKRIELEEVGSRDTIDAHYREEAERILAAYDSPPRP